MEDGVPVEIVQRKGTDGVHGLRIEQVSGHVESPPDGVHSIEITTTEDQAARQPPSKAHPPASTSSQEGSDDEEPSVLEALSSEQLARRPSFKKILDDLSSADQTLKGGSTDPLAAAAAATLQAQHAHAALQQAVAASGLPNSALIPGILQGMQQSLAAGATPTSIGDIHLPPQISMMLPSQQSLQSALLNAQSLASVQSPILAGAVQTLANQTNLPASLLSSALLNANMAATLSATSTTASAGLPGSMTITSPAVSPAAHQAIDDTTKKREVRLMKNREAARECRRKKKEYVRCLENRVAVLESQNQALIGELRALKELYLPKTNQD